MTKAEFIELVTADQPDAPPYFTYDAVLNSRERATLSEALERELQPLSLDALLDRQASGAQVLDTRDSTDFAAAHLAGSINIGLGGQYATWAGTVLEHDAPIVLIADPGREQEAATRLGRIGFDQVVGYLEGGLRSLDRRPDRTARTERLSPTLAAERLAGPDGVPMLLDVRTPREREQKAIAGSLSIPLNRLPAQLGGLATSVPIVVYCAGGYRSSIAASLLKRAGFPDVAELAGGITAWETARLPLDPAAS